MKKILSILIALIMCISLIACGDGDTEVKDAPEQSGNSTAAHDESAQDVGATQNEGEENLPAEDKQEEQEEKEAPNAPDTKITFDGLTVVDNDECSISITEIDPDNLWGYTLKVNLENKSPEKTYMFSVLSAAVNGVQWDPFFASEVAAGKKAIEDISFSNSELEALGMDFTDIEITFRVYDSDDWMAEAVATETVHVYPYGEDKAELFERAPGDSDNIIVNNEQVTATVIGYDEDNIWGYTVMLFLQNKTDSEVMFSVEEVSVNGYMADPFWATSVLPGKCAFSSMSWSDTTLDECGITDVEEIEFLFRAHDYEDWMADDLANESIILNP